METGIGISRNSDTSSAGVPLNLDFRNQRYYLQGVSYSALSSANGGLPGWTFSRPGYNSVVQSQALNSSWVQTAVTVSSDVAIAPDGTLTADKIVETSATNTHQLASQQASFAANSTLTASAYFKAAERNFATLQINDASSFNAAYTSFNLATGTVAQSPTNLVGSLTNMSSGITAVGNGWYRAWLTVTLNTTANVQLWIGVQADATTRSYAGSNGSGIFAWGAQLEPGSVMGGYQPTTGAAVTSGSNITYADGLIDEIIITNQLTWSQAFDNAVWSKANSSVVADTVAAPDGTMTADKLNDTSATGHHAVSRTVSAIAGTTYTFSSYAKAAELGVIRIAFGMGTLSGGNYWYGGVIVNLNTGASQRTVPATSPGAAGNSIISFSVLPVGNGWYRISITLTAPENTPLFLEIYNRQTYNTNHDEQYAGTSGAGTYIWGAQLETRSSAGNYSPTTSSPASGPSGARVAGLVPFGPNQPRVTDRGLLVEEARTNIINQLGLPGWNLQNITSSFNAGISPIGTNSAIRLTSLATGQSRAEFGAFSNGVGYAVSVYVKYESARYAGFGHYNGSANFYVSFDLLSGTVVNTAGSEFSSASIQALGAGWYRLAARFTSSASGSGLKFHVSNVSDLLANTGVGISALFWNPQLEEGSFATSPIPTTTTAVTRASDNASVTGLSAMLGQFRTNLLTWSQAFDNAAWNNKAGITIIADSSSALGGANTADTITETSATSEHGVGVNSVGVNAGVAYTLSVYAKPNGRNNLVVRTNLAGSFINVGFDISAGTVTRNVAGYSAAITPAGFGWYRVSISGVADTSATKLFQFDMLNVAPTTDGTPSYTGDGISGVYLWGAQLETGSTATSYIPTTTAAAASGNPVTLVGWGEYLSATQINDATLVSINDGTFANMVSVRRGTNASTFGANSRYNNFWNTDPPQGWAPGVRSIIGAARLRDGQLSSSVNGSYLGAVSISGTPALSTVTLGNSNPLGSPWLNGYVQRVQILGDTTNAQLLRLTA